MNLNEKMQALWDKQEITEVMYKFARALDRVDGELMKSTYWDDAIEEHQDPIFPDLFFYNDNAWAFVDQAMEGFRALKATQHRISNVLIELDGNQATAECYVWAYHLHDDDGDFMSRQLNVDRRAVIPQIKMLRCKNGANIELFEFENTDQRREPPRNNDVGGHHIAFYVDDMEEAVAYLRSKNVRVCGEPTLSEEGANAGLKWVYFLSPWGMQLELVSSPTGMAYEKGTDLRVWQPEPADQ